MEFKSKTKPSRQRLMKTLYKKDHILSEHHDNLIIYKQYNCCLAEAGAREVASSSPQTQLPMMSNDQSNDRVRGLEPDEFYSHLMRS